MMLVMIDVDGTIDSDPPTFLSLMQALRAAGHRVVIGTGCSSTKCEPSDIEKKREYLQSLGVGQAYDLLVVFSDPVEDKKAQWLKENKADLLIDNRKGTARVAPCTALVPWSTRE